MTEETAPLLDRWEITPRDLRTERYWIGNRSIAYLSSMVATLWFQRYLYRQGLRYFLAVTGKGQVERLRFVRENINTITYEQFRNTN